MDTHFRVVCVFSAITVLMVSSGSFNQSMQPVDAKYCKVVVTFQV